MLRGTLTVLCVCLLFATVGLAQTGDFQLDIKKHTLSNGMRILVLENHSAPVFSTIIRFNTGAVDERPGITGISHLLEHMLFKGTKIIGTSNYPAEAPIMKQIDSVAHLMIAEQNRLSDPLNPQDSTTWKALRHKIADLQSQEKKYVIKDELWDSYLQAGGTGLNASTGNDGTQYFVSLPKNRLELWAYLESDRLANLIFREFYSERDVVMEERRLSLENQPWGRLDEAVSATAFWANGYKWPVVGWMSDLKSITREDCEQYFKSHYSPANAVAVVVGDVKADEVFALADKYFAKVPSMPAPPPVVSRDAPQMGERRVEVEMDANPMAMIIWKIPQIGHPDIAALDVLANILSSGRTSRLYKNVTEKGLGNIRINSSQARYPETFGGMITPFGKHTLGELEDALYAEIERVKTEPVTEWELARVRNQYEAQMTKSLESNMGLAFRIANSETLTHNPRYFVDYLEAIKKVTAEDVMRVANTYLTKENRTVGFITKVAKPKATGERASQG